VDGTRCQDLARLRERQDSGGGMDRDATHVASRDLDLTAVNRLAPFNAELYLVFKIAQRLEQSWRPLNGGLTIMSLLLGGARFVDGVYVPAREVSAA
jgi:hypothetical protein